MNTTSACLRCGRPVSSDDRQCGACGAPQTPTPTPSNPGTSTREHMAPAPRLLEALRTATVGEYEIRGEIGRGGMAAVYLAYDLRLNRKVAMKVMLPELAYYEGMEERFKREARTAAKLDHPNIVVIHTVRDDAELLYFVMKYIEGVSLDQLIRVHPALPIPVAQYILVQLAGALQYAHDEGVVHRDIKPGNVLIDLRGNVLVTDFGIAKASEAPHLTRTGSVIGTPTYMSPEQCLGNEQTHASDQYSLGVVAYEIIAGRPPFLGSTVEKQWAHIKEPPPPLATLRAGCPPHLADGIMRMLAKEPAERWATLRKSIPALATGLVPGDDTPRTLLADLVRLTAPNVTHDFAITPASPLPKAPSVPTKPAWASLAIEPPDAALEVGTTVTLQATLRDTNGTAASDQPVEWASTNPDVASVSASGDVTAHALGVATITVAAESLTASATVNVVPDAVGTVSLEPPAISLTERTSERLTATVANRRGQTITGRRLEWRSANPAIATVTSDGVVTARSVGRTAVTASVEGRSVAADVIVRPADVAAVWVTPTAPTITVGDRVTFSAEPRDRSGHVLTGRPVTWRSSDTATVTIDRNGVASGLRAGVATVTAECGGVAATAQLTVAAPVIARLEIEAPGSSVRVGKRVRLRAKASDLAGREIPLSHVTWRTSDAQIARVEADGTLVALREGGVTVTGAVADREVQATIAITPPVTQLRAVRLGLVGAGVVAVAVAAVVLIPRGDAPPAASSPPPEPAPAVRPESSLAGPTLAGPTGTPNDPPPAPQPQPPTPPVLPESNAAPAGPPPPPAGTSTAVATLRVTSPNPLSIEAGERSRVTLRATTEDGDVVARPRVSWTSENPSIISVTGDGVISALAEGSAAARATADGATARVAVVVRAPAPVRVAISPRPSGLRAGQEVRLGATVEDRRGSTLRAPVMWRSSDPGVASVDNNGTVRGHRGGQVTISARAGSVADDITLSVAAEVAVRPDPAPAPVTGTPSPGPAAPPNAEGNAATTRGTGRATAESAIGTEVQAVTRALSAALPRGQVTEVSATAAFARFVRDNAPVEIVGAPSVGRRTVSDSTAEAVVTLALRWKDFAGRVKNGSVDVLVTLALRDGTWRRTGARNLNSP